MNELGDFLLCIVLIGIIMTAIKGMNVLKKLKRFKKKIWSKR